jgi:hypothetical protein
MHRALRHGILLCTIAVLPCTAFAQKQPIVISQEPHLEVRGDFQVHPKRFIVELAPGESKTVEVAVLNRFGSDEVFSVFVEDFFAIENEVTDIQFYGNNDGPYSARHWIKPALSHVWLQHGDQAFVPLTITVPKNAKSGDYYAAALFQRDDAEATSLVSRMAALLLVSVKGDGVRQGQIENFLPEKTMYLTLPPSFFVEYRNTGTVFAAPTGVIEIQNMLGLIVDRLPLKDWFVLRNSVRSKTLTWSPQFALGRYTATLRIAAPGGGSEERVVNFWVLPLIPLALWIAGILIAALLIQLGFSKYDRPKASKKRR